MRACQPDVVIHTQALSDVDQCEREPRSAEALNIETTRHVIKALDGTGAILLSLSTDYVFDGLKGSPYHEDDPPHPISVYGQSKLDAERVSLGYARAVVIRPSTLFGSGRMNFCDHIVSRLTAGQPVEVFRDQVTSPTYTDDAAEAIAELLAVMRPAAVDGLPSRVLHVTNEGGCSRLEFAERVADLLGCSRQHLRAIDMAEQRRPARRPPSSVLTTRYLPELIGRRLRPWDEALRAYLCQRHWLS